jgi:prephenate dehydrogenase
MFNTVAVFGLGLLGGSLCKGLRSVQGKASITAYARDPGRLRGAVEDGTINSAEHMKSASLSGVDLVVIATPVIVSLDILRTVLDDRELGESALVIDVGSVKGALVSAAESHPRGDRFIGCHPMAGSEKMGYAYSRSDLYRHAPVIITPHRRNAPEEIARIRGLWETLGARTVEARADTHDAAVARTSHLPHLAACVMMDIAQKLGGDMGDFVGGGFRDVTRVASGSPDMWTDITAANRENITRLLDEFIDALRSLKGLMPADYNDTARIRDFFERVRGYREKI